VPSYDLDGRVAIVTGGGRGIGRAIALRLAREGAAVLVADLGTDAADDVVAEIIGGGGRAASHAVDVRRPAEVEAMTDAAIASFGGLDILVNNAGIGAVARLLDTSEQTWDDLMDVNAKGTLLCSQSAARRMIAQGRGGRIVNNASGAGKIAPGRDTPLGAYAASKHAVVALTKQLGLELAEHQILVNCVCAGIVDTPMWDLIDREVAAILGVPEGEVKAGAVAAIPLGRIEQPEDVAAFVAFLCSDDAAYITAQALNVCGGMLPY
jgi:meso-butanediol dehydrogenase / (S,S)-butanediol dehydrogenase / diacetyl reductase